MDNRQVILIVDDTYENLRVLGDLLEQDYDVRIATNGPDALTSIEMSPPNLVLLDIVMAGMGGYEVCRRLKSVPEHRMIPVIFISALGMSDQKIQAFKEGAVDYITKPFQADEVVARVRAHLQLSKLEELKVEIAERKQAEANLLLLAEILQLLNGENDLHKALKESIVKIGKAFELDSVGLRIQSGSDYPYFVHSGFPVDFVEKDSELCVNGVLECMCGVVLSGRTDARLPYFTSGGSFYINTAGSLGNMGAIAGLVKEPRNRCIREGYNSIALIALKSGEEVMGLLQMNHRAEGKFTPSLIGFFEGIATSMAIAVKRKHAEEVITESLCEKELLIREIHHRTRNTIQVIRGILVLQTDECSENKEFRKKMEATEARIEALSLVHQMLYETKDLSRISLNEYLAELTKRLMKSMGSKHPNIELNLDIQKQYMLIDTVMPVGLIINELMTNSLKHAFVGRTRGTISIRLVERATDDLTLEYMDDGIGVPLDFDFRKQSTLGLQLIFGIGEGQMRGKVEFENRAGLSCSFQFKNNLYKARV